MELETDRGDARSSSFRVTLSAEPSYKGVLSRRDVIASMSAIGT